MRRRLVLAALVCAPAVLFAFAACVPSYRFNDTSDAAPDTATGIDAAHDSTTTPIDSGADTAVVPADAGADAATDAALPNPTSLSAASDDNCLVRGGTVLCWGGQNGYGQLGAPTTTATLTHPRPIDNPPFGAADAVLVSKPEDNDFEGTTGFACALASGAVYCWGYGEEGQRGDDGVGAGEDGPNVTEVPFLKSGVKQIALGAWHACALVDPAVTGAGKSNVYCWGRSASDARGPVNAAHLVTGLPTMSFIAAGGTFSCGIAAGTNEIWCWGESWGWRAGYEAADAGMLGPDAGVDTSACLNALDCTPRKVVLPAGTPVALALGRPSACALTADGAVYCWGSDDVDEIGNAITQSPAPCSFPGEGLSDGQCQWTPVLAIPSGKADAITAGAHHTCAHLRDGTAMCWGYNAIGQLGNNSAAGASFAVPVLDPSTHAPMKLDAIAAGGNHTCGLRGSAIYCWGTEGAAGWWSTPSLVTW